MPGGVEGLPETIGRYQVRGLLGRGGMGRVVAGHDPVLRRDVAIKLVEPAAVSLDDLAELRFMFHREARATAALRHPNIVEVFDYSGPDADLMFIAVELIDGETLAAVVGRRGALTAREVAAIGYELASALEAAHEQGIVHRDLKPENVFWTSTGRIVLSDFGIAKAFDGSDRLGGTIQFGGTNLYGSPSYIAPEQLSGGEISHLTDIYALGTVLYECLVGEQAFGGHDIQGILDAVAAGDLTPLDDRVSPPPLLGELITSCLRTDPAERPNSAARVARQLRQSLDGLGVTDPRLCLRDDDDATAVEIEAIADRALFEEKPLQVIRVPMPEKGLWAKIATKGPVLLGMVALAILLGTGVHLVRSSGEEGDGTSTAPGLLEFERTVSTDASRPPSAADRTDVFVLLKLQGRQTVFIDGIEVGTWSDRVRLALPPGRHTFEVRSPTGNVKREVMLLKGTQPEFELFEP